MVYLPTFTIIYHKNQPNVGKYTIHGWYGSDLFFFRTRLWSCIDLFNTHRATKAALRDLSDSRIRGFLSGKQKTDISFRMGKCIDLIWKGFNNPRLPKSSKYLVIRYLDPPKAFSGGVCGSKHLLTRYLEDWVNKYGCVSTSCSNNLWCSNKVFTISSHDFLGCLWCWDPEKKILLQ